MSNSKKTSNIKPSIIPESFQAKLFDLTGPKSGGCKGFLCFYVDENGDIQTLCKIENTVVSLALFRAVQLYLKGEESNLEHNIQ